MEDSYESTMLVSSWDYDVVLEKIGYGKAQWLLLLISGLLTITSVASQQAMGIIVIASHCEFQTTQAEKGLMMASCVAGISLSTYFWGYISDNFGRRKVLLHGVFVSNGLQIILMFVTNMWFFNIISFLGGISIGGISAALYAYLSEFHIPRHRAVVVNYSTMFVSVTAIFVPATAWMILSSDWSIGLVGDFVFRPWRFIMFVNLLPGFLAGLLLLYYPESPKFLLSQNQIKEAVSAVAWIGQLNRGISINQILNCDEFTLKPENQNRSILINKNILSNIARATMPLFHKPHVLNFILCNLAIFGMFFSSNGMQFWFPEIVNRSSRAENANSSTVCEILSNSFAQQKRSIDLTCINPIDKKTYIDNMIVGVAFLVGFCIQGTLLNPLGRKNVLLAALVVSTISGILLHFVTNATAVLVLFCLYILLPGLSISIMLGAVVDFVPTNLRGKAVSICLSLGRLGSIAATNLMGIMLQPLCNTTFAMFTSVLFVCIIIVCRVPIKNST
ncbi:uncharacterized protein Dwil_GK11975 [Drosophila willistoni]|uniref:Major facilitator superfamily (MFS) profile domain-containing protein n=1 Tax=Drosophila willistoni TaxID=7260 RepID=B4N822_DROWI|nr:synaptic vesicle glycoprotein 2A [Drosophila willistoni]EDW81273.2 uncharacterized protein Dwil_GK11975 [Drosophila willistoni]